MIASFVLPIPNLGGASLILISLKFMIYQDFITKILTNASQIAKEKFGKISSAIKPDDPLQVLTEVDLAVGKLIVSEIKKSYPEYNVIDEETGSIDNKSKYTWVIDPIDGTSNFASGVPTYGIMIGLLKNFEPIAGGVVLPSFNEIYYAEKGQGAFCNNKKIFVNQEQEPKVTLVAYGVDGRLDDHDFTRKETKIMAEVALNFLNIRSSNSVFDAMMLARGSYIGLLNQNSKIWDNVAQQIIIEEAGGLYTDFHGQSMDYSDPSSKLKTNFTHCAAPPFMHKKLQEIIHKLVN